MKTEKKERDYLHVKFSQISAVRFNPFTRDSYKLDTQIFRQGEVLVKAVGRCLVYNK